METDKIIATFLFVVGFAGAVLGYSLGNHDLAVFSGSFATFWSGSLATLLLTKKNGAGAPPPAPGGPA
jgi:hypothetical protein